MSKAAALENFRRSRFLRIILCFGGFYDIL